QAAYRGGSHLHEAEIHLRRLRAQGPLGGRHRQLQPELTPACPLSRIMVMPRLLSAVVLLTACALPWAAEADDYEIGPGDVLHVIVLEQAGLTGEFKVDPEGLLSYPFLGKVKVSGMSTAEVERKLATLLSEGYP